MKAKILIIDFDLAFALALEQILTKKEYQVFDLPANVSEAIALCQNQMPDLVLMDINLQGSQNRLGGAAELESILNIPVLYLVESNDIEALERGINMGSYGCLIKPIEASRLYAAIETTLAKYGITQELKLRNARTDAIFSASPDIYFLIDCLKKQVIDCRSGHETAFFFMQNQITGKKYNDVLPPKLSALLDRSISQFGHESANFTSQYRMRNLDQYQYYEARFITIKDQNEILCIVRNVSELKLSEEKFKENKNQLENILNTTDEVIWSISPDRQRTFFINPAAARHYGLELESFAEPNRPPIFFDLLHPDDRPNIVNIFESQTNKALEYRIIRADNGQIVWFSDNIVFKKNPVTGQIVSIDGVARNITQHRSAQIQLEETEKLLRQISENSLDMIYLYDYQTKNIIYANRLAYQTIFGFEINNSYYALLQNTHTCDKKALKERDFECDDNENMVWEHEFRLKILQPQPQLQAEWEWFCAREKIFEYDAASGKPKTILGTVSNINPQKQARAELLLKNKAIEDSIISIAIADARLPGCPIIYVNQAFSSLTHYQAEEVNGRHWDFLYYDDLMQPEIKIIQQAREQGKFCSVILRNYTKDRQLFWSSFALSPIQDLQGIVTHFVVMQADLSRIKKLEEQISQIKTAVESAQDGICITDIAGNIVYLNHAFKDLFGYDENQLENAGGLQILTGQQVYNEQIEDSLVYGKSWSGEFEAYHQNQTIIPVFLRANPIIDKQNYIIGFMRNYTDVSEKIYIRNLQIAKDAAEQATALKQQFLDNMSHELRTPLNGIVGMSDYLLTTPLNPDQTQQARIIQESAKYLHTILNDILDLSKLENNKIQIFEQEFNTEHFLHFLFGIHKFNALQKGLELKVRPGLGLPELLKADRQRLAQVCNNLLSNAIKFTQIGNVSLVLDAIWNAEELANRLPDHCAPPPKSANIDKNPDQFWLLGQVSDTGIGIEPDMHKQVFEKFDQVNNHISRTSEGTGLGLSIVLQLVGLMGGQVWLESTPNRGSIFGFWLPAHKAKLLIEQEEKQQILTDKSAVNIEQNLDLEVLLVEDKKVNQLVAIAWLESFGCRISVANNGLEALEIFEQKRFDIVLMDIRMPVMDGLEATSRLRTLHPILPPIIALTADVSWQTSQRLAASGLDDYISKPILFQTLFEKLSYWKNKKNQDIDIIQTHSPESEAQEPQISFEQFVIFNPETLNGLAAQSPDNLQTQELIKQVIAYFFEDAALINQQIRSYTLPQNQHNLDVDLHTLKGLCATIGASRLSQMCIAMENQLKASPDEPDVFLQAIYSTIEKNLILLEEAIKNR